MRLAPLGLLLAGALIGLAPAPPAQAAGGSHAVDLEGRLFPLGGSAGDDHYVLRFRREGGGGGGASFDRQASIRPDGRFRIPGLVSDTTYRVTVERVVSGPDGTWRLEPMVFFWTGEKGLDQPLDPEASKPMSLELEIRRPSGGDETSEAASLSFRYARGRLTLTASGEDGR